jgi:hypothetical protein
MMKRSFLRLGKKPFGTSSSRERHDNARRLKTLNGLTPYEYICKIWTSGTDRFIVNPIHQMPGLNTLWPDHVH